ncbi:MAG: MBL fold metallo-hydrolase [Bacteroidota bacterium]
MPGKWCFRIGLLVLATLLIGQFMLGANAQVINDDPLCITTYSKQFVNVHLVSLNDRHLLIDAGLPNDQDGLLNFLREQGVAPADIDFLILTHAHPDHAGSAAMLQQEYGIPIIAGAADSTIIAQQGGDPNLCVYKWPGRLVKKTIAAQRGNPAGTASIIANPAYFVLGGYHVKPSWHFPQRWSVGATLQGGFSLPDFARDQFFEIINFSIQCYVSVSPSSFYYSAVLPSGTYCPLNA